jgi:hypothetical protein
MALVRAVVGLGNQLMALVRAVVGSGCEKGGRRGGLTFEP